MSFIFEFEYILSIIFLLFNFSFNPWRGHIWQGSKSERSSEFERTSADILCVENHKKHPQI